MYTRVSSCNLCLKAVLALACCALSASTASAQPVKVTVIAIMASEKDAVVEKELECIAKEVRKKDPKLTSFRLHRISTKSVKIGEREEFPLIDKQVVTIEPRHGLDENCRIGLKVKPPKAGEITYACCCGKFFPIATRYVTEDGQRLILAIKVQECDKKK